VSPPVHADVRSVLERLQTHGLLPLVEHVCQLRGVTTLQVCSRARTQNLARTRHEIWWRMRQLPDRHYSYAEIGLLFGRNHSTIKCAVDAFQQRSARHSP